MGSVLVVLLFLLFIHFGMPGFLSEYAYTIHEAGFLLIAPVMEIIGIGVLWKNPVPQRFMSSKLMIYGARALLGVVYVLHLFMIYFFLVMLIAES